MNENIEVIINKVLVDLNELVKAKTEEAVRSLQKDIEESIKNTGDELIKKCKIKEIKKEE